MDMNKFVWDELKFFIGRLSSLRMSETLRFNDEAFCVYTGTSYENMIFYPNPDSMNDSGHVNETIKFFTDRNAAFMWFVSDKKCLEHSGLIYSGDLIAMTYESNCKPIELHNGLHSSTEVVRIDSHSDSALWTRTMWRSFGYEGDVPDNYYAFFDSLLDDREHLSLYLAFHEGEPSGTIMTTSMGGVYYVGVVPEKRRKGIACEMLNEICRHNTHLSLQATPSGYELYRSFGFTERFRIPLYSNEAYML